MTSTSGYILVGLLAVTCSALAESAKVERAQSAAHSDLSQKATILDMDGSVLQSGNEHWHCYPGVPVIPGDQHPMCVDSVWSQLLSAAAKGEPFETDRIGISYMMQGDAYVSNSNPAATDPNNGDVWVKEGPHLMIVVPKALLKGISDDPFNGGPYVMWKDTPYAHIMVPVANKAPEGD
ncbi:hypothetical protein ACPV4B_18855 [Vibrio parahaemolyticus]|uniref:hypothetical protein n=1 Tax=Vibrio mediterranei TaxID=689 RepID=UPI0040676EED